MGNEYTRAEISRDRASAQEFIAELQDVRRFALPRYKTTLTPKLYSKLVKEIELTAGEVSSRRKPVPTADRDYFGSINPRFSGGSLGCAVSVNSDLPQN
jgi:hypothetical protein